jgi:hypothetical protein
MGEWRRGMAGSLDDAEWKGQGRGNKWGIMRTARASIIAVAETAVAQLGSAPVRARVEAAKHAVVNTADKHGFFIAIAHCGLYPVLVCRLL